LKVIGGLVAGRGGVAGVVGDLAVEATLVEPVDTRHDRELDVVEATPRALSVDQLPSAATELPRFCELDT
jgi:hypothetical protein